MLDMRTETEDKDTKIYWRGGKKDKNRITGEETDGESTMKRAALWQTQTFRLKMAPYVCV